MQDDSVNAIQGPNRKAIREDIRKDKAQERLENIIIRQDAATEELQEWADYAAFNPLAMKQKFEKLEEKARHQELAKQAERSSEGDSEKAEKLAKNFNVRNPELNARTLLATLARLNPNDSAEDMLRKVRESYPDHTLADEALDFMIESTSENPAVQTQLKKAKNDFNDLFGREIKAGKNINVQAQEFSKVGLGSPTALRDMYRDIVGNPRDPHTLFDELSTKFAYKQMKQVVDFVLHSLGADLKAKGPSIPRGELSRLFTESRIMQAFLGLYKFFQKRMSLVETLFDQEDLALPGSLNFEVLAKQLMQLVRERYPTPDKVRRLAMKLGISQELAAQIIIFGQYRDALRNISPRLFKSERHRQDMLLALIEALSDLEDELEEEEDEEDEE